jgi:hypothetical protein
MAFSNRVYGENRYALIIGHNLGDATEDPLRYAEDDARRMRDVLIEIGGVARQNSRLLTGPTAQALSRTMDELASQIAGDKGAGTSVVFVYFAGHGDNDTLHLGQETYSRERLRSETDRLAAEVKIIIIDACQTLRTGRQKGVRVGAPFAVSFSKSDTVRGAVTIQSSKVGEPAHESDHLKGALFTHYLLTGLRGVADANQDGRVTMLEAYQYAYHHTVKDSAAGSTVVQHPNFDIDLAGTEDLVMTTPTTASARLVLRSDEAAEFTVFSHTSGVIVAEIRQEKARALSLAVPRGRLLVQKRVGDSIRVAEVTVAFGDVYEIADYEYEEMSIETMARRGHRLDLNPNTVSFGFHLRGDFISGDWILRYGALAGYERRFERWSVLVDVASGWARYRSSLFDYREATVHILAGIGRFFSMGLSDILVGIGPVCLLYFQHRVRLDAGRLEALGQPIKTNEERHSYFPGGALSFRWTLNLWRQLGFFIDARAYLMAISVVNRGETSWRISPQAGGAAGFFYRF